MKGKLLLLTGAAAGYVLGTRAGRERYEQIKRAAGRVKDDPRVQKKAHQAADLAQEKAHQAADLAQEKAHQAADLARAKAPLVAEKLSDAVPGANHATDARPDGFPRGDLS